MRKRISLGEYRARWAATLLSTPVYFLALCTAVCTPFISIVYILEKAGITSSRLVHTLFSIAEQDLELWRICFFVMLHLIIHELGHCLGHLIQGHRRPWFYFEHRPSVVLRGKGMAYTACFDPERNRSSRGSFFIDISGAVGTIVFYLILISFLHWSGYDRLG